MGIDAEKYFALAFSVKVHLRWGKANAKPNFSVIFVADKRELWIRFSMNPSRGDVAFAFASQI